MSNIAYSGKNLPSQNWKDIDSLLKIAETPVNKLKPYTAQITRNTPTAFVFLLDQSRSMVEEITVDGTTQSKAEFLASFINKMLNEVLNKCKRDDYRDYLDVCIIGYGGDDDNTAKIVWEGPLKGKTFVTINELQNGYIDEKEEQIKHPRPDGTYVETTKKIYSWITPQARKLTPMYDAFRLAYDLLIEWLNQYPKKDIYPPSVFNISDGMATGTTVKNLYDISQDIRNITTMDGNVLLFNIHLSQSDSTPVIFPCSPDELPDDDFAQLMFEMSSDLPENYNNDIASLTQKDLMGAYTGLAYNSDMSKLISLLNIGTNTPLKNIK